ncbi:MAG: dicarboxylate/amino acid:cation symporter [Planctomycetaceae bacterium]
MTWCRSAVGTSIIRFRPCLAETLIRLHGTRVEGNKMADQPSRPKSDSAASVPGAPPAVTPPVPVSPQHHEPSLFEPTGRGWMRKWNDTPLYLRILGAVALGIIVGLILGPSAGSLALPSDLVLRLLRALAAPLILLAIIRALIMAEFPKGSGFRLLRLLLLNTLVAILIGLFVANVAKPGKWIELEPPSAASEKAAAEKSPAGHDPVKDFLDNVPKSLFGPLGDDGKVISVIMLAIALGIALRRMKNMKIDSVTDVVNIGFDVLIVLLHWVIAVIPLAIFGVVASIVGVHGFQALTGLGIFVITVIVALVLQVVYYLVRIKFGSWVRPWDVLRGMRDALVLAFSTASSTATMPLTYACLREKIGVRERSASLGALVGANFNNDGTALYEAMAALFVAQLMGVELSLFQQFVIVLTSVAASVGAAGIPEAGIVTMTGVLQAAKLDTGCIPILLTVDWFLDRCRTTVNVLGDVNVSCLLDGKTPEAAEVVVPPTSTKAAT